MKNHYLILLSIVAIGCLSSPEPLTSENIEPSNDLEALLGSWIKMGPSGPVHLEFGPDSVVLGDFGGNGSVDIRSRFTLNGNAIEFLDESGRTCPELGVYRIDLQEDYISFSVIQDECQGRIQTTLGFWTRMDYQERLEEMKVKMAESHEPEFSLTRGRVYLALGDPKNARTDFDHFLAHDTTNARAYVNRAATRFPDDMMGIIHDCDRATALDPELTNAYFLRGLALKSLRNPKRACSDFRRAADLGLTVLLSAEQDFCSEYWMNE